MPSNWLIIATFVLVLAAVLVGGAIIAVRNGPTFRRVNADEAALRNADPNHVTENEWWRQ